MDNDVIPPEDILVVAPIYLGELVWQPDKDPEFDKRSVAISKCLYQEYQYIAKKKKVHIIAASDFAEPSKID